MPGRQEMKGLIETKDKDFVLWGNEFANETTNIVLIKVNAFGDTIWTKRILSPNKIRNRIVGVKIGKTPDPNIFVVAAQIENSQLGQDIALLLINDDAEILKLKKFYLFEKQLLEDVSFSEDGVFIFSEDNYSNYRVTKASYSLDSIWSKELPITTDYAKQPYYKYYSSLFYKDHLYVSVLKIMHYGVGNFVNTWALLKLDSKGDSVWLKEISLKKGTPERASLLANSKGNIVYYTNSALFMINEDGETVYTNSNSPYYYNDLLITEDDNFIMTYPHSEHPNYSIGIRKLDQVGTLLWEQEYSTPTIFRTFGSRLIVASDGNLVAVGDGEAKNTRPVESDPVILKTSADGSMITSFSTEEAVVNQKYSFTSDGNLVFLSKQSSVVDVNVFSPVGINLFSEKYEADIKSVDLSFLSKGVYLVKIKDGTSETVTKFIRN